MFGGLEVGNFYGALNEIRVDAAHYIQRYRELREWSFIHLTFNSQSFE